VFSLTHSLVVSWTLEEEKGVKIEKITQQGRREGEEGRRQKIRKITFFFFSLSFYCCLHSFSILVTLFLHLIFFSHFFSFTRLD